jgi:hypothetical protein
VCGDMRSTLTCHLMSAPTLRPRNTHSRVGLLILLRETAPSRTCTSHVIYHVHRGHAENILHVICASAPLPRTLNTEGLHAIQWKGVISLTLRNGNLQPPTMGMEDEVKAVIAGGVDVNLQDKDSAMAPMLKAMRENDPPPS